MEGVQFWTRGVEGGDPDLEYGREMALEIQDTDSFALRRKPSSRFL